MDDRIEALERVVLVQNETLVLLVEQMRPLVDHMQALAVTNAALLAQLGSSNDRAAVRAAALAALPDDADGPVALVEALTAEPTTVPVLQ